ncbi:cation diffusion facilitator family transporter [Uliginosibacterium sp. H1]|uniref:cation diffusion facilitator family transporter n=1 Tax=Uliginosibacterium sp. H1 TaxID=3114757 RepID=UPI002E190BD5|nr:cation diffusion facilitator family transporter [Uliginosibacterium sp. H1]
MPASSSTRPGATRYVWLSIVAALATIGLKLAAWWLTGSVGLLSDALESFVNLFAAVFALSMVIVAAAPPDEDHPYGHSKAEYFSSGFEGTLILLAAAAILWTAIPRLWAPQPLETLGIGLWLTAASTAVNLAVSRVLSGAAQRLRSVALEADARHLMTDVWTSCGVVIGLLAVLATGWLWLDAAIAVLVALRILAEGWRLMRGAVGGLMDEALPADDLAVIEDVLEGFRPRGLHFAELQTRRGGHARFISVKVRVPGDWRVDASHGLLDEIEAALAARLPGAQTVTHLEPLEAVMPLQAPREADRAG